MSLSYENQNWRKFFAAWCQIFFKIVLPKQISLSRLPALALPGGILRYLELYILQGATSVSLYVWPAESWRRMVAKTGGEARWWSAQSLRTLSVVSVKKMRNGFLHSTSCASQLKIIDSYFFLVFVFLWVMVIIWIACARTETQRNDVLTNHWIKKVCRRFIAKTCRLPPRTSNAKCDSPSQFCVQVTHQTQIKQILKESRMGCDAS